MPTTAELLHDAAVKHRIMWTELQARVAADEGIAAADAADQVAALLEKRSATLPVAAALINMIVEKNAKTGRADQWPPASGVPAKRRFKRARSLRWGETPFDDLTRAELLRLVQAYHSAVTAARGVMLMAAGNEPSAYWSSEGMGGRALAKANHLMALAGDGGRDEASERIYRSFFRAADVLMFPHLRDSRFHDWGVNDHGEMVAPHRGEEGYRPIEWRDMLPQEPKHKKKGGASRS